MEFESPDVEKDFPGLYASESGKKSNESDFSDEAHERPSKKDLLIGKRKDKKDSKKDRGYAALEGESSPEEDPEIKSPSKSKKSKSFKFPSKKEKREKSREKEVKEKERDSEKEKKKEKETKMKLKLKERKKSKHLEDGSIFGEEQPVFGVPLHVATERSHCHDGAYIPLVIRECIDYVQENGLTMDSIYKLSGIKSKVQYLRRLYNQGECVQLSDYEPPVVTSLLKQFFRELPEPILTNDLLSRFEEAAAEKEVTIREAELQGLISQLPKCNLHLLGWMMVHLDNVTIHEKYNKMNAQNIAITLSPVLQMSHRLLTTLLCHCRTLFPDISIVKYVPPLSAGSPSLPDTVPAISVELAKQESLLNHIHQQMNAGYVSKRNEEQLWEVQRLITQLKRKLRTVQRSQEMNHGQKSLEEKPPEDEFHIDLSLQKFHSCSEDDTVVGTTAVVKQEAETRTVKTSPPASVTIDDIDGRQDQNVTQNQDHTANVSKSQAAAEDVDTDNDVKESKGADNGKNAEKRPHNQTEHHSPEVEDSSESHHEETLLRLEYRELLNLQADLQGRVAGEKAEVKRLQAEIAAIKSKCGYRSLEITSSDGSSSASDTDGSDAEDLEIESRITDLQRENLLLQQKKASLIKCIMDERKACINLRVQLSLLQLSQESKQI
ncbi:ralA-binding protein 1 [Schistocerca cancellata]|uniref:ralA-binding protein 1 n=1 Tax=Schistocerca cancellata TaxID=274614 RepID=UPI0021199ABD|nr:ralA-binding protein 1 [Schistocerca cancellata]XP_049785892.1 ralA-binding protein 1 [Schistocerca cancellata]XP_049785900.1 ralA-binding protein 1 [Schistocerca cancellata]